MKRKREPFFSGYWVDPVTGRRLERVRGFDYAEVGRLWSKHADTRTGRVRA